MILAKNVQVFLQKPDIYATMKNKLLIAESKQLQEVEILAERKRRTLLVIKARWIILASYVVFGLSAAFWFNYRDGMEIPTQRFMLYGLGIIGLLAYNAFLHYSYEKLSEIKGISQIQMVIDVFVTTTIIYFTGGAASWFWSTYLLIILQSAFLFDRKIETIEIAALSGLSFGLLTALQYAGLLKTPNVSFLLDKYGSDATYASLMVFWVIASSLAVAFIASYLMGVIRLRERYLAVKSITDGLTGLYNHSYFHKRLSSELDRATRYNRAVSLVVIDVDDFKQYNDTFGHQEGDKILHGTAKILKDNIRSNDIDTVFRYGGEEFALILPETSSQDLGIKESGAIAVAERIRVLVEESLPISISVGIASFPHHADNMTDLFKTADDALYRAKEQGKNRVVIYSNALKNKKTS